MKTYYELSEQLLSEAKAPAALVQKAEEARKKSIQFTMELIDKAKKMDPKPIKEITQLSKDIKRWGSLNLNTMSKEDVKDQIEYIFDTKRLADGHKMRVKMEQEQIKFKAKDDEIEANPVSICDILADKTPNRFISLLKDGGYEMLGFKADGSLVKWVEGLNKYQDAFADWFEMEGGYKASIIKMFKEIVACKTRAPWAYFEGKVWRGVTRTDKKVARYSLTGETKKVGRTTWFIAKGKYVSRYDAQSWSIKFDIAADFAEKNNADLSFPIPVVFEVELAKKETLLSPEVTSKVSGFGKEKEVIRIGNNPLPVTIYLDLDNTIREATSSALLGGGGTKVGTTLKQAVAKVHAKLATVLGDKNAKAILSSKYAMDMVTKKIKSMGIKD